MRMAGAWGIPMCGMETPATWRGQSVQSTPKISTNPRAAKAGLHAPENKSGNLSKWPPVEAQCHDDQDALI